MPTKAEKAFDAMCERHSITRKDIRDVLDCSDQAVGFWRTGARRMRPEKVFIVEKRLGIPRWELRPDLWQNPEPPRAKVPPPANDDLTPPWEVQHAEQETT